MKKFLYKICFTTLFLVSSVFVANAEMSCPDYFNSSFVSDFTEPYEISSTNTTVQGWVDVIDENNDGYADPDERKTIGLWAVADSYYNSVVLGGQNAGVIGLSACTYGNKNDNLPEGYRPLSYFGGVNDEEYIYEDDALPMNSLDMQERDGPDCYCALAGFQPAYSTGSFANRGNQDRTDKSWFYLYDLGNDCYDLCPRLCADEFINSPSFANTMIGYACGTIDAGNTSSGGEQNHGSSNDEPTGNEPSGGSTPARSPLRVAAATHNVGENALVSAAYARGAYNANVANINNAIEYVEDSSIATINSAKVSADNVSLSVNGFTPSGTVSVNSSNATVSGTFSVPTTVALMDSWGSNTTTNATLGGNQPVSITNGGVSGISATFTGTASGNLSGTGSFSNASVHVDGWKPVNPQE